MKKKDIEPVKKNFIDPLRSRKKERVEQLYFTKDGIPLPSVIEISESGMCNRKCSFCPRSDPDYEHVNEFIPTALVSKMSKELAPHDYKGLILFSGFVEPLLDKNIYNLISIIRKDLPNAQIEIISNGDVLNKARVLKLFNAGLSALIISIYDGDKEFNEMHDLFIEAGISKNQYKIRKRYLSEDQNFGLSLSNRGGMMENAEYKVASPEKALKRPCYIPDYTFFLNYTGEVLTCNHDWGKKLLIGNLNNKSFMDLWLDHKFIDARKKLYNGDRNFAPCNKCDVDGTMMGKPHADAWESYKNKKKINN